MRTCLVSTFAAGMAILALCASPLAAQSLADVAKKEEARRTGIAAPTRTYTNADLRPDPTGSSSVGSREGAAPPTAAGTPTTAPGNASAAVASAETPPQAQAGEVKPDEAYWRSNASNLKLQVEKARQAVAAVSKPAAGDEREQAKIAALLAKAQSVLDQVLRQQDAFNKQADAAKVPKEWIK